MHSSTQTKTASDLDMNAANPEEFPTDTISSISWTHSGNNLTFATSDWASYIRIYSVDSDFSTLTQKTCFDTESPCLSVKWHEDETTVFAGCTDGSVKSYDVASGVRSEIGHHEGPVKSVHWISASNTLLTVSFDRTVRFWDLRQVEPVAMYQLNYKPFCSDVLFPYLAIGLSDAKCLIVDLQKIETELGGGQNGNKVNYLDSPLRDKPQMTSIRLFFGGEKYGVGTSGNEGKCNISSLQITPGEPLKLDSLMTFKAHKIEVNNSFQMHPVNTIGFHPHRGSQFIYTAGGEGKMIFWDNNRKTKATEFDFAGVPVTQAEFDPTGEYMAYSLGYDWARGIQGYMSKPSKICVHRIQEKELAYEYEKERNYPIKYP